jgi:hypothetical protein
MPTSGTNLKILNKTNWSAAEHCAASVLAGIPPDIPRLCSFRFDLDLAVPAST